MFDELKVQALLDLSHTLAAPLLASAVYPFEALPRLSDFIKSCFAELSPEEYDSAGDGIYIAKSAKVASSVSITGPCLIGPGAELRHCAFIRGSVIVGENAVVGNSTELKNAVLFDRAAVPHFNYVGDSILGYKAHFGAGVITSNVKSDQSKVSVLLGSGQRLATGLKKFGVVAGDHVEVGCNAVLNPGTVIGRNTTVYPLSMVRGFVPERHIYKSADNTVPKLTIDN